MRDSDWVVTPGTTRIILHKIVYIRVGVAPTWLFTPNSCL